MEKEFERIVAKVLDAKLSEFHDRILRELTEMLEEQREEPEVIDRLLSKKEVAEKRGVSTSTIDRWISDGIFPHADVGTGRSQRWKESTVLKGV